MDDYPVDSILVGAEEFVFTTHVTHQQLFYVHVESRSKILDDIMNKLETRYTHLRPEEKPLLNKRLGSLCAAKFTDDGVWYRAKITGLLKNGHIEVQFVDYGNTDYVTEERIKAIDADLIKYPVQSYRCCLADVSCPQEFWTPELIIQFEDRVIDRRCRATFVGENEVEEMYLLQMCDSEGISINQLFGAVSRVDKKAVQNGVFAGSGFKEISFDIGAVFHAAIVYVNSPGLFWCQNMQFASDILILSEELSRLHMIQEMKPLQDVHKGVVCAAKFSQDEAWYRGIVHSVSAGKAKVYFVDYGNTEVVSLDVVCNLKPEMKTLPALGIKCRLSNVDIKGREWTPEVIEAFEELVVDKEFEVKVVGKEGDVYIVTLFDVVDNKDVGAQLQSVRQSVNLDSKHQDINCNKQVPSVAAAPGIGPSFNVGSQVDVYISWVENPGDFWVQQRSAEELLEQLSQQLQEVYSLPQPSAQPTPGAFVVARFSQDGMWYRSLVLKVFEDEKVRVLFIDYGNSDVVPVSDLRQVTAAFGQVIPLASRCCLAGVKPPQKGDKSWAPEAKTFMEKISEYGCQCEILSETSSHKIVNLKVGSRDVAKDLLKIGVVSEATAESKSFPPLFVPELTVKQSETEQVIVTHIDSPKNFWCQATTNIPLLRDLMKQLSQHYACGNNILLEEPIIGQACIVFSNKDKLWYRAKITNISSSTYSVHFLDFGNSDAVPKCNVFVPEPKFMDLTAQAFHCGISVSQDSSLITNAFKQAVCKKELRLQVLEVSGDRAVVELFDGNMKVSEILSGNTHVSKDAAKEVDFVPAKEILAGSTVKAFASFVVSPNKFFIHMTGVDEELEDLMDSIALVYNCEKAPPVVANPHSGQPCVALYAEDGNWYRGRIVAVQGNACIVLFVDFGNEDTVNNDNIRVLTSELAQVPVLSYKCSVHGVPEREWSDDALQYFEALVMEKELACTFVASSSVRVLVASQDVAGQLLKAGYGGTSGSDVSMASKQSPSDRETEISTGSDRGQPQNHDAWDSNESASAGHKHADSHSFGKNGDSGTKSDRRLKYTDVRREESTLGDGRAGRESGGRNGRDSRVESDRRDWQSGDGRDSGSRRGRDSRFEGDSRDVQSSEGRDNRRGMASRFEDDRRDFQSSENRDNRRGRDSRFENDRRDLQSSEGRDSRRGRDSRFENDRRDWQSGESRDIGGRRGRDSRFEDDRRDWQSGEGRDSGRYGGPHRRDIESGGFRDAGDRHARGSRFEGATRNGAGEGRDSDSSSGGQSDRNSHGRESQLGGGRGQGNRFNGSREFSSGHNDRRMTTGQPSASMNTDFTYAETPCEAVSTILVHMDEDGTFYLQLPSMEKDILLVSTRVAGSYKGGSGPRLRGTPVVGTVCCAKFADDGNMYRAKVEDVQGSRAVLRYVDYGNTGECSLSDLKFLFPDLLQYPAQAFPCQLRGYHWSLDEAEQFAKATLDKDLKVTFISNTCPFQVDLMTPEGDLLKVLTGESAPPAQKLSPKPSGMPPRSAAGFGSKDPNSERDFQKVSASPPGKGDGTNTSNLPSTIMPKQMYSLQSPPEETLAGFISHVGSDGFFYVQLAQDLPTLESIHEQLLALPDNIKHPDLSQGASCAAVFSEDSAWYRAEIIGQNGDSLSVCFVDYGNEDSVSTSSVKPLSRELLACPPLAYKSQFSALGALPTDAQSKLAEYLTEHQVTVAFSGQSPPFSVCIKTEQGEDLQDVICPLENYRPPVVPKEVTPVGVTHIEDDGRFFVQLYQNYTAVKELQDVLKTVSETESAHIESAEVDMACCFKVEAGLWQRGKVIEVAGQSVHVFLVDSGETVITDVGSLRSLPVQFLKTAPYALECRLKGVGEWAGGLLEKFSEMTQDKILNATFHGQTFPLRVSLARSIELDLLGLSAPPPDSPEKSPVKKASPAVVARQPAAPDVGTDGKPAYISHVDTHGGFYVQIVDREEDLNDLADKLEAVLSDSDPLNEVAAGDVVCAQFTEDDAWYRARIESCTDDGQFLIRFIDYGNSDVVGADRLKALPEELDISTVPPFAVKCRFCGVADDLTPEQADKLREMVAEQTVNVAFRSLEDDVQEVEVSLDGLHVAQSLGLETLTFQPDFKKSPDVEDDESEFFEAVEDLEKCEEVPVEDLEKCEEVPVEDLEKCEEVPVEDLEKCEEVPVEDVEKCEEVLVEDLEKCEEVPVEDLEKCEEVPVEDLEKCEEVPVVKKAVMETTDASLCPGLSSTGVTVDVVDSASGTFQLASAGASTESAKQELESPSSGACVKDGKPPNTASELSLISDRVPVSIAASAGGVARVSVSADDRMEVTVSHVDSPHKFYMQLDSNKPGLDDMMDALFEHVSSQSETCGPVEAARVGDVCAALYEESWYRVRVESVTCDGTCEIFYVDYGHTEVVDVSSLQHLPDSFKSILPWALRAKLGGVDPNDGCWTQEAVQEMRKLVEDRHLLADILQVSDDGVECTVHLLYLGIPVHEELVKKGHAVAVDGGPVSKNLQHFYSDGDSYGAGTRTDESSGILESTHVEGDSSTAEDKMASYRVKSRQTLGSVASSLQELAELSACVSHSASVSPCHFWCQLTSSSDTLSEITSALARMYGSSSDENTLTEAPCVGDVVVVSVFGNDGVFYRAQVLNVIGSDEADMAKKVRVRFVDYGHESAVPLSMVFKFHEKLYAWPAQAFRCCLDKVQPVGGTWTPQVLQAFSQTVTRQQLLLTLVGREQDGVVLVDAVLQETGQSLSSLMVEAGLATAAVAETDLAAYSKSFETSRAGDISELESLEMSQPILESTTMVMCSTRDRVPTVSFEEADDEHFRSVKLSLHTEYNVVVSNDELPSCFHVQLLELQDQHLSLVTEIADHVASHLPGESAIFIPALGDPCLVQHCGTWYRGLVTNEESDLWSVKSIDCGWVVNVSSDQLMALPTHLREPPAQAVPCYLAGIVSVELEWATNGIAFFIDSVQAARLCMYVLECADDGKYGVYLSDLDNTGSQSVNRALVDLGYAEVVPGSNIEVQIEMERTLDTDMMQDLEESFNEVSQLKCNADSEWEMEAVSSIAFDSENPLKETYEDSDVFRTAKLKMDKTLYHLVQIPKSMMTSSESRSYSEDKNCLSSTDGNLPSSIDHHALQHEAVGSQKVRFDCASAVERIDKMGCVDNYSDEGLFAEYESLEDAVAREDRNISRDSPDDIRPSRPDVTAQGAGADHQAKDFSKSEEDVAGTSVQNCAEVQTSCVVKSEAATTTANSFEHDNSETNPYKEDTAQCGQPMVASSDAGDDPRGVDGGAEREDNLRPSHDDVNSVHPIQDVKDEELSVDAAGDAGPCDTAEVGREKMEAPEA